MSSTFVRETGFIQTNATTPVVLFMNQYQNATVVVDIIITPITATTVPLKITIQTGGQIFTWIPTPRADGTYVLKGMVMPYLGALRAYGNSFNFVVVGTMEQGVLPAGMTSVANSVALMESHPDRPLGTIEPVLLASPKWGAVMDVFMAPITGPSPYPARATVTMEYPAGGNARNQAVFNEYYVTSQVEFRKITVPPACTVKCRLYGNVSTYFQWVWQRTQETPDL